MSLPRLFGGDVSCAVNVCEFAWPLWPPVYENTLNPSVTNPSKRLEVNTELFVFGEWAKRVVAAAMKSWFEYGMTWSFEVRETAWRWWSCKIEAVWCIRAKSKDTLARVKDWFTYDTPSMYTYNSNWTEWSTIQGEIARSARPIWNNEHDFSLNCSTRSPVTN